MKLIDEKPRPYIEPSRRPEMPQPPRVAPRLTRFAIEVLAGASGGLFILFAGYAAYHLGGIL